MLPVQTSAPATPVATTAPTTPIQNLPPLNATQAPKPVAPQILRYYDIDTSRMQNPGFEKKQIPEKNPNVPAKYYYQITNNYAYPDGRVDSFVFEGPEVKSFGGIVEKAEDNKPPSYSIAIKLPKSPAYPQDRNDPGFPTSVNHPNYPKIDVFVNKMEEIYRQNVAWVGECKMQIGKREFNPQAPAACGFKNPIFRPFDQVTGNIIEGKAATMFIKVIKRGSGYLETKTLFTGLDGKEIDWRLLQGVEMSFIPMINVEKVYIGATMSLQIKLVSAIVTDIVARNSISLQVETMAQLRATNPDLENKLAEQIKKLEIERLSTKKSEAPNNTNNQSAQSGLPAPSVQPINPSNPVISPFGSLLPTQGGTNPTHDQTGGYGSPGTDKRHDLAALPTPTPIPLPINLNPPTFALPTQSIPNIHSIVSGYTPPQ